MDSTNSIHLLQRLTPISSVRNNQSHANHSDKTLSLSNMHKKPSFDSAFSNSLSPKKNIITRNPHRFNTDLPATISHSPNKSNQIKPSPPSLSPDKPATSTKGNHPRNYTIERLSSKIQENIFQENARDKAKLNNILKVNQDADSKTPKSIDLNEKAAVQKITDRINQVFQKKDLITLRQMPTMRHSNSERGSIPTSPKLKNIHSPFESPLKANNSAKKWIENGTMTLRESQADIPDVSSFGYLSSKAQREIHKSKLEPLALSHIGYFGQTPKTKSKSIIHNGWSSGRSPETKFDFDLTEMQSQLVSPKNQLEVIEENVKSRELKENKATSKIFSVRTFKVSGDNREKLNEMIKKKKSEAFDQNPSTFAEIPVDPNASSASAAEKVANHDRNTLHEAMREYEKSFHDRFTEIRKGYNAFKEAYMPSKKPLTEERKWARELPSRKAFTIAPSDNIIYESVKPRFATQPPKKGLQTQRSVTESNESEDEQGDSESRKLITKHAKFKKIRAAIRAALIKYANLKITPHEILNNKGAFPERYYEKEHAERFIKAAKKGDLSEMRQILQISKYYVYEFDPVKQTALHWAVKRGFQDIVVLLLSYGADPDSLNLGGRPPLYYAIKGRFSEITRILLLAKAIPWNRGTVCYKDMEIDRRSQIYLNRGRQLNILLNFHNPNERNIIWEKEARTMLAALPPLPNETK